MNILSSQTTTTWMIAALIFVALAGTWAGLNLESESIQSDSTSSVSVVIKPSYIPQLLEHVTTSIQKKDAMASVIGYQIDDWSGKVLDVTSANVAFIQFMKGTVGFVKLPTKESSLSYNKDDMVKVSGTVITATSPFPGKIVLQLNGTLEVMQ